MKNAPMTAEIGRDSRPSTLGEICSIELFPKWSRTEEGYLLISLAFEERVVSELGKAEIWRSSILVRKPVSSSFGFASWAIDQWTLRATGLIKF